MQYNDLIGKPFKDGAYGPDAFCCYGLAWEVNRRLGKKIPYYEDICAAAAQKHVRAHRHRFDCISPPLMPGDLVLMRTLHNATKTWRENHVAVMIGVDKMLQVKADAKGGVQNVRIDHPQVKNRIVGFYRYIGDDG